MATIGSFLVFIPNVFIKILKILGGKENLRENIIFEHFSKDGIFRNVFGIIFKLTLISSYFLGVSVCAAIA